MPESIGHHRINAVRHLHAIGVRPQLTMAVRRKGQSPIQQQDAVRAKVVVVRVVVLPCAA